MYRTNTFTLHSKSCRICQSVAVFTKNWQAVSDGYALPVFCSKPQHIAKPAATLAQSESVCSMDNPCEAEVAPGKKENIREFYLKEARRMLSKMTEENAKRFLELKIKEYE